MDSVELARFLTAMTLAVHIIFATIGGCAVDVCSC